MKSRWLTLRQAKRRRMPLSKALPKATSGFRFESLERRYCMASDMDVSQVPDYLNTTPPLYSNPTASSVNVRLPSAEVICEVPVIFKTSLDSELCIDNFAGPRMQVMQVSYRAESAASVLSGYHTNKLSASISLDAFQESDAGQRPDIAGVQQRIIGEGEGPAVKVEGNSHKNVLTNNNSISATEPSAPKDVQITERHTVNRTVGYVSAVDWTGERDIGSTKDIAVVTNRSVEDVLPNDTYVAANAAIQSAKLSWTGLSQRGAQASVEAVQVESRPHLASLPGLDVENKSLGEHVAHSQSDNIHLTKYRRTESIGEHPSQTVLRESPMPATDRVEEGLLSSELPVALSTEEVETEEETSKAAALPSRSSRYWFLAAIPAFFILPRRTADRRKLLRLPVKVARRSEASNSFSASD